MRNRLIARYIKLGLHPKISASVGYKDVLNAILYVAENGCKWRAFPERFGNWHTLYTLMNRWSKAGVLSKVFEQLQLKQALFMKIECVCLNSTSVKVHPDGMGALKKTVSKV